MAMDSKIKAWMERKIEDDYEFADDCAHYDDMVAMKWSLPPELAVYSWVRKRVSTVAADIIKQSCNIFDTFNPKFEILPQGPEGGAKAEKLERWGEFQMRQANSVGDVEPFREIMRSSVTYDRISAQVEYSEDLPYDEKPENPFCIYVYQPATIHYDMGGGVLRKVAVITNVYASDVIQHWEPYVGESSVKSAIKKLQDLVDADDDQRVIYADYTDKKKRWVGFCKAGDDRIPAEFTFPEDAVTILDTDNKRGFINWAIVKGSSGSALDALYKSGLIENQNLLDTAADTTVMRRMFYPLTKHSTQVPGKELEVDFDAEASGVMELGPGETADTMMAPPLDPGIRELMDRNAAKMNSTSGIQTLSDMRATNVQAATIQAVISLKMTELEPYQRNAEKCLANIMKLMFMFVKKKNAYAVSIRSVLSKLGKRGDKIVVGPEDFDPKDLIITCTLLPNTGTDKMQKVNMYMQLKQAKLPIPDSEIVERLDMGDADVNRVKWEEEQVRNGKLNAFLAEMMAEVQVKTQLALRPPQEAPNQGNPDANPSNMPAFDQTQGQGFNPAGGGVSPAEAVPPMTQTVMQGMNGNG